MFCAALLFWFKRSRVPKLILYETIWKSNAMYSYKKMFGNIFLYLIVFYELKIPYYHLYEMYFRLQTISNSFSIGSSELKITKI